MSSPTVLRTIRFVRDERSIELGISEYGHSLVDAQLHRRLVERSHRLTQFPEQSFLAARLVRGRVEPVQRAQINLLFEIRQADHLRDLPQLRAQPRIGEL